jgi:hypothetical protein
LVQGISIFGGYDNNFERRDVSSITRIISSSPTAFKTEPFPLSTIGTTLQLLTVSSSAQLSSSRIIVLNRANNITLSKMTVIASQGVKGADGARGTNGDNGGSGFRGGSGCENGGLFCIQRCNRPQGGLGTLHNILLTNRWIFKLC